MKGRFLSSMSGKPKLDPAGQVVSGIERWHNILKELSGRKMIHDELMRYEAIALVITETTGAAAGTVFHSFPRPESPLLVELFFSTLY
jgi:hypothetical protein